MAAVLVLAAAEGEVVVLVRVRAGVWAVFREEGPSGFAV